ncbi:RNA recognition motif domain-containing protein [Hufsiella ginkgonis]|uniref:RRM domain-containing protein n=1 Tax=Hufsiella ginkgonis TaxID=2695274 RepID=A0A7K1XY82_9SPHI|nr:RNA-binding protein [Hufsiella ginkgonis]MXV15940.1 hypothetical protein [Hufsiella ginkgonis]
MKIFVGGLPKDITDSDLLDAFTDFGQVSSARVVTDKKTGISRSYGFVEMPDREQAMRAIEALHEAVVDGMTVSVKAGVEKVEPPKKPFVKGARKPYGNAPAKSGYAPKRNKTSAGVNGNTYNSNTAGSSYASNTNYNGNNANSYNQSTSGDNATIRTGGYRKRTNGTSGPGTRPRTERKP